ncbi:MAG: gliding motility-associated C-terminal domain-containing protein [Hymenobacter sp.]|nr:MAG: gliding motility-associated C-terminal domain-containing protein [Hymenobacter sp.]
MNPLPVADAGVAVAFCSGGMGQLGAAAVAGLSYSWSPATGLSNASVANPTVTLTNATGAPVTQTYTLTVTNAATSCAGTSTVAVTVNPLPVADAGPAVALCSGSTGQLGAAAVVGVGYSWSPATGLSSSTVANPGVSLMNTTGTPIIQTYTLTATNTATNCVNTSTVVVTVNPLPVAAPGAASTICSGGTAQLGAAAVAGFSYSWSPATGLSSATVANPTATLTNPTATATTQVYTLTVTNLATACASTATVAITVSPAIVPGAIGTDQTVCAGAVPAPLTSTAAATGGRGAYDYQWESSPDMLTWKAIANVTTLSYAPSAIAATTYYRRRVTVGTCGLAYTNVVTVQAQQLLLPTVALPTLPPQCAGLALTFTPAPANAGAAPTYRWFVNGTQVATGPTYTSSTLADGDVVQVELTPTVGFCATGTAIAATRVSLTAVPVPALTIILRTTLPVCVGAPISFSLDRATNVGTNPQYQWQVDGVAVRGATTTNFTSTTLRDGQVVTLTLRTTDACGQPATATSNAVGVRVNPPVHVSAGPDKTITEGESVTLEGTADGSYPVTWTPSSTLALAAGGNPLRPVATPLATTTYTLAAGAGYCAGQSSMTVTVLRRVRIPNAFTPNADNNDDTWQIAGIEDYPGSHVLVFNRWGQKVFEAVGYNRSNEWNGTVSGGELPFATYYYVITLGNGKSYTGPLTIVR